MRLLLCLLVCYGAACAVDHPLAGFARVSDAAPVLDAGDGGTGADMQVGRDLGPDGEMDGGPGDLGPDMCVPTCSSGSLEGCGSPRRCDLGCEDGALRCLRPVPSNLPPEKSRFHADAADLIVGEGEHAVLDPASGTILDDGGAAILGIRYDSVGQGSGLPAIHVFWVGTMNIAGNLTATGNEPVAIIAYGEVTISGVVDMSANGAESAPGGGLFGRGSRDCGSAVFGGGGGGGHASEGGRGGHAGLGGGRQGSGGARIDDAEGTPLLGGGDGGRGCDGENGGGGGGGLQITGRTLLVVTESGVVRAHGGGGKEGGTSGAGGGAGGTILVEAPQVMILGHIVANGGSGGEGDHYFTGEDNGLPGQDGTTPVDDGCGGQGGAGNADPGRGDTSNTDHRACGGGGAAGRILVKTDHGAPTAPGLFSPAHDHGLLFLEMESE